MAPPHPPKPSSDANLYLVGLMGAGKSTIGRGLAADLDWAFCDLDEAIEHACGRSIPEIFRTDGEEGFRNCETDVLARVSRERRQVVALGGGTPLRPENRRILRRSGTTVYLQAEPATLARRLAEDSSPPDRPLLHEAAGIDDLEAELARLLAEREPVYRDADLVVANNGSDPDAARAAIRRRLRQHGMEPAPPP